MAMFYETIDGVAIETGFWGYDTSKVQLGELPPITTPQFAGYAALTLAEVIPVLDEEVRQQFANAVPIARARLDGLSTLRTTGLFIAQDTAELFAQMEDVSTDDRGELLSALSAAVVPTDQAVYYKENPFTVEGGGLLVKIEDEEGTSHVITARDFMDLVYRIMRGGIVGWNEAGTYQEIKTLAVRFEKLLSE